MEDCTFKTISATFAFLVLCITIKLVNNIWWRPRRLERLLRKQGIKGSSYKPFTGDMSDIKKSAMEAASKPIVLNHQGVVPRVIPFYHTMVQQYGKVSLCWFGRRPRLIIADAELMRLVLTNKNGHFVKKKQNPLIRLLTKGVSSLDGQPWTQRRRVISSAFLLDKLKAMVPAFSYSCCTMIERWQQLVKGQGGLCEIDATSEFNVLTGDVIARTAFGSSYQEGKRIFQLQKEQVMLVHEALNNIYIPGFRFIPTKKNKRRYYLDVQIKGILRDMIQKKEEAMKDGELEGHDLLSILLQSRQLSNNALTTEDVIEECKLFYFAGQETTANLLAWTMIVLSMHPHWQEKARGEVLDIFGTRAPDFEAINRLKIVSMILYEVLRLYPPVVAANRHTSCETRIGSMSIPAGVEVYLPILHVHYDSTYWENPEEFNPERFAEGVSKASKDENAFYPFSWGPRICLGQNFAFLEAKMALSMILQHFSFQLSPSYAHAPCNHLTLKPQHGAPIIIQPI